MATVHRVRATLLVSLLLLVPLGASCYHPSIADGGLTCAPSGQSCPEGYACYGGHCYRHDPDAAIDARVSDVVSDRGETSDLVSDRGDADSATCAPRQAKPGCTPNAALSCDPVCQTGCCTSEKCTALNDGPTGSTIAKLGCSGQAWLRSLGEPCDVTNAGTISRADNCLPGFICVEGNVEKICLQLCRNDADCAGGVQCESRPLESRAFSASVCGLLPTPCNPVTGAGCPPSRICYLISSDKSAGDRTVCDITSGDGGNGTSCKYPFECSGKWTCPTTGVGAGRCQPECDHNGSPPNYCPVNLTCQTAGRDYDLCL